MGKSPHSGGESRFFPDACSGIPERARSTGDAGLKDR